MIDGIELPDPNDRHVVAAAIKAEALAIISADRHFRDSDLERYGLSVWRPNTFLMRLWRQDGDLTRASLAQARRNFSRTVPDPATFILGLRRSGQLDEFRDAVQDLLARFNHAFGHTPGVATSSE